MVTIGNMGLEETIEGGNSREWSWSSDDYISFEGCYHQVMANDVQDEKFLREVCISIFCSRSKEKLQFLPEVCCVRCVAKEDVFKSLSAEINKVVWLSLFCLDLGAHGAPKDNGKLMLLKRDDSHQRPVRTLGSNRAAKITCNRD